MAVVNRSQNHDEKRLYAKIQWLTESLHIEGYVKFFEACTLESIQNAVSKLLKTGIITKKVVPLRKGQKDTFYSLSEKFMKDEDLVAEIYQNIVFFLPYFPN